MDILTIVGTFFRRWYLTVPIVVIALVIATFVQMNTPSEYEASGSVLLANPELDPSRLPLTERSLDEVIDEVGESMTTDGAYADADIELRRLDLSTVEIEVGAPNEAVAQEIAAEAADRFSEALASYQEERDVPENERTAVIRGAIEVVEQAEGSSQDEAEQDEDAGTTLTGAPVRLSALVSLSDPTAGVHNPFGASSQTIRVLEVTLEGDEGIARLQERAGGREVEFDISQGQRDAAPIVAIDTAGSSPEMALNDFDLVVDALAEELEARQVQAEVPESRRVTLEVLAAPQMVEDVTPPLSRLTAGVVGLGGLLALGVALLVESVASRRRRTPPTDEHDGMDPREFEDDVETTRAPRSDGRRRSRSDKASEPAQTS